MAIIIIICIKSILSFTSEVIILGKRGKCKVVASSVRSHFFDFHKSTEKLCASWALPLIECVAVWTLKLPVPHTDAFKTHVSQSFSADLLEFQKTSNDYLMHPTPPAKSTFYFLYATLFRLKVPKSCHTIHISTDKKKKFICPKTN